MNRRDFVKTGTLGFSFLAASGWAFSFDPFDARGGEFRHCIPFRKKPRDIRETVPGFLWADAADFGNYGGWALDTQHVGFMGSSCLLAHGTSQTVNDAVLDLRGVKAGRYRLWVRSRNWIPQHSPGRFGVMINGADSGAIYGAQQEEGWTWQDGGVQDLPGGPVRIALQDKTGQFGRCSSLILTRDLNYQPPADIDLFKKERARLSGVSDAVKPGGTYDVIVVGAGPAGGPAALASARSGAKTALISNRPVLGGNASAEIGVPVQGAAKKHPGEPVRETGIIEEAGRLALHEIGEEGLTKGRHSINMSRPFQTLMEQEPQLDLYENFWLEGVKKEGRRITEVILVDTLTGERMSLSGAMFIDCTGDGWLGHYAGADERVGREAFSEYREDGAPEKADRITMSACLRGGRADGRMNIFLASKQFPHPQPFKAPAWAYRLPDGWLDRRAGGGSIESQSKRLAQWTLNGTWWLEHPGEVDDLWDPEFARDELIRVINGFWGWMKNEWSERELLADFSLDYVPFMAGKRETRRLMGDYVLNANDAIAGTAFDDVIAHTGWTLDVHAAEGILSTHGPFTIDTRIPIGQIPYRCLYSRNMDNLLMAGRCASVTHLALGTVRIEASCAVTGQAAGTAAALALKCGTTPRGVYQKHMKELQQQLLKDDQYVPGVPSRDPADLARTARLRASSTNPAGPEPRFENVRWLPLNVQRGEFFPWRTGEQLNSVRLFLDAKTGGSITLHLRGAAAAGDLSATTDVATITHAVPAGTEGWITIPVNAVIASPFAWIVLDAAPSVQWRSGTGGRSGGFRVYRGGEDWVGVEGSNMFMALSSDLQQAGAWAVENIVNGIARPTLDGQTNTWESDPGQALPQWVELQLRMPSKVGMIQCVFDPDLTCSMPDQRWDCYPQHCVRDYRLECLVNGEWKCVAQVRDNFQRFRRHRFAPVTAEKIRLTVDATRGAKTARVVELRAYAV